MRRRRRMPRVERQGPMKTDVVKLVTFQLGGDLFAADVKSVERVLRYEPPAAVPDAPSWVAGVLEHRGKVMPVVDLRRRVELAEASITPETRILVLGTVDGCVGAIVDRVLEVTSVAQANVSPPPALFRGLDARLLRGIAKIGGRLIVVLDVDRLMSSADRIVLE